jgi:hypothetical protein
MPDTRNIRMSREAGKDPLVKLYQTLDIDQCVELYLKQKDNLNKAQKTIIKVIIGSKYIYGKSYEPGFSKRLREEQKIKENTNSEK